MAITIWTLRDGNRGHEKQLNGLLEGLRALDSVRSFDIDCRYSGAEKWREWLGNRFARGRFLPEPDLIIGAGHRTHLPLLTARNRCSGRAVVLMRPSLPVAWFDYAIIPEHDRPPALNNVIVSRGVLAPGSTRAPQVTEPRGLILLGGESKYFAWDNAALLRQLRDICQGQPQLQWVVADSRRTPTSCTAALAAELRNCRFVHWRDVGCDWLAQALAGAQQIWVSPDSVSMLSEALNCSASVGVLDLPSRRRQNKVSAGVSQLSTSGQVTPYALWRLHGFSRIRCAPLNEHLRCAAALLERMAAENNRELAAV